MSVLAKIISFSEQQPKKIAIIEKERKITYAEFVNDICLIATKLHRMNVRSGDNIIITAGNTYAFIVIYFSAHMLGASVVNIAADAELSYKEFVKTRSQPVLQIESCNEFLKGIKDEVPYSEFNVCIDELSDLVFTSGTTGEPKGVALTHRQVVSATEHIISQVGNTCDDVELLLMPLCHSFGMGRMRTTLYAGGTLVLGYLLQRLKGVFKAIDQHQVTGLGLVPSAWHFITQISKNLITKFAGQIKYIEFGSAYLSVEDKTLLTQWFPDTHIVMHYGLTEVSRAVFLHFNSDNLGAVGHISHSARIMIVSDEGQPVPDGEIGEIALKAPWMFSEYYQNNELTESCFINGYFRTGDLGKLDGDYLYLTGRLKEIINVGGKKVSPYQVEDVLLECDLIKECACIALPDSDMGEVVQAFFVPKSMNDNSQEQIINELTKVAAKSLPVYMRPLRYTLIETLPKTSSGKIQRLKLSSL